MIDDYLAELKLKKLQLLADMAAYFQSCGLEITADEFYILKTDTIYLQYELQYNDQKFLCILETCNYQLHLPIDWWLHGNYKVCSLRDEHDPTIFNKFFTSLQQAIKHIKNYQ